MEAFTWLERAVSLGAAIMFFAIAIAMVLYETARAKAKRPILKGGDAGQYGRLFRLLCSWGHLRYGGGLQIGYRQVQAVLTILLIVLPFGTALICGALTDWAGRIISGWCSVGGLILGIYFFHKSMEFLMPS